MFIIKWSKNQQCIMTICSVTTIFSSLLICVSTTVQNNHECDRECMIDEEARVCYYQLDQSKY